MTEYSGIRGTRVKYLSSDPTLNTSTAGQVWYNSTTGTLKSLVQIKAWSSSGSMSNSTGGAAGFGIQTAAVRAGGETPSSSLSATEEYSGFSWSNGGALPAIQYQNDGAGTLTAGLSIGGFNSPGTATLEYDGSSWTAGGVLPSGRFGGFANGIQTAALYAGGDNPTPGYLADTFEYNGSSWTAGNALNTARRQGMGVGTQTAAIAAGGRLGPGPTTAVTESYDGTNWTTVNSMNTARKYFSGFGTQDNAIGAGGYTSTNVNITEEWDGTNWTTLSATLATARGGNEFSGSAPASAGVTFGGTGPATNVTEEYNSNINAITQAAWAAGGSQNTSRVYSGGSGPVTSALIIGGFNAGGLGGFMDDSETYNGTSWTSITNFPYNAVGMFGLGDAEAFIGGAGYNNSAAHVATTAEWSGSSWTSGGNVNGVGQGAGGTGTQTAGIIGNRSTGSGAQAEEYDGSSWTTTPATNVAGAAGGGMAGTQTAALLYGASPSPLYDRTESWNGSSWTSVSALNTGRRFGSMGGSQTAALFGGGNVNPPTSNTAQTELYNGTSWVTSANMATARFYQRGGSHTAADSQLATSGSPNGSAISAATEEYSVETTALNTKTLTTS